MKYLFFCLICLTATACERGLEPINEDRPLVAGVKAPEGMAASADEMVLMDDGKLILRGDQ